MERRIAQDPAFAGSVARMRTVVEGLEAMPPGGWPADEPSAVPPLPPLPGLASPRRLAWRSRVRRSRGRGRRPGWPWASRSVPSRAGRRRRRAAGGPGAGAERLGDAGPSARGQARVVGGDRGACGWSVTGLARRTAARSTSCGCSTAPTAWCRSARSASPPPAARRSTCRCPCPSAPSLHRRLRASRTMATPPTRVTPSCGGPPAPPEPGSGPGAGGVRGRRPGLLSARTRVGRRGGRERGEGVVRGAAPGAPRPAGGGPRAAPPPSRRAAARPPR